MNDEQTPALRQAVENMTNMREAYDNLSQAAKAYNTGKVQLAKNITTKGVQASASETLPELAEKVNTISQKTYEINGGEMYTKQLFGSLETPNYWNLYEILENLLSDGRLVNYGGILLAEYYKGYDSLVLEGAGSGGAYVVSDKDENGNFIMYTNDTTHTWNTEDDGKGNRWVAYCFAYEGHDFDITDTNTSPRSIHIGRRVGVIKSLVNGRISKLVITDGSEGDFISENFTQNWGRDVVIRNISHSSGTMLFLNSDTTETIYISGTLSGGGIVNTTNYSGLLNLIFSGTINGGSIFMNSDNITKIQRIVVAGEYIHGMLNGGVVNMRLDNLKEFYFTDVEDVTFNWLSRDLIATTIFYVGYRSNDKTKSVTIGSYSSNPTYTWNGLKTVQCVKLQKGWCKPLNICSFIGLTEENIYTYILQKLKQDKPDCGDGVTITLGQANIDKLTSEKSIALLDELTNTYGYSFA